MEISPPKKQLSDDLRNLNAGLFVFLASSVLTSMQKLYAVLLLCHVLSISAYKVELKIIWKDKKKYMYF